MHKFYKEKMKMTLTELKIYAMSQAAELNLPTLARTDMLSKIKDANLDQTIGYILDQEFHKLSDRGEEVIKELAGRVMSAEETKKVSDKVNKRANERLNNVKLQTCHKKCQELGKKLKLAEDEKRKHKSIFGIKRNTEKYDSEIRRLYQLVIKCQKQCDSKFDKKYRK